MTRHGLATLTSRLALSLVALAVFCQVGTAQAEPITFGSATASTYQLFPFGGVPPVPSYYAGELYSGDYQQIYSSTPFSGPVTINSIGFATASFVDGLTGSVDFSLSLSTTPFSTLTNPSTTYADNYANLTQVYSGTQTITAGVGGLFDFVINTSPFLYNPSQGDLLLDVNIMTPDQNTIYFEANADASTAEVYNYGGNGAATVGTYPNAGVTGLATQFGVTPSAVPEPASLAMLGLGLGLTGAWAVRRRHRSRRA